MNETSNALVLWILVLLFTAVGLYLIWYTRRRKKMLQTFSKTHHLPIRPEREETLQKTLDSCFSLKSTNMVRSFAQLSSIIDGGSIWIFRAVELLDLNPHARSYSTHFPRIAALFNASTNHDEFFVLDKSMRAAQKLPGSKTLNSDLTNIIKQIAASCNARHPLSVTLARGQGLIYFEPLVTGGETLRDIGHLYCIAKRMHKKFG
ncbi:MAG: hypothetical protein JRI53_09805 [Deltaproteobacteria bacterium]|nr:hypothetical protein [Deltaproteobacteria bacterium]MBW1985002.1 hypothetical protein [Deltaproteobacteria bacterium]MBW2180985.1 hypothetical protein [Deltaproteobacteria bacterium]MBW2366213.1 hypothetical protein [Deltaproteobacteria bacterium]